MVLDSRYGLDLPLGEVAELLCSRPFGIGAQGLVSVQPSRSADFRVVSCLSSGETVFRGSACLCAAAFIFQLGLLPAGRRDFEIEAEELIVPVAVSGQGERVKLGFPMPEISETVTTLENEGERGKVTRLALARGGEKQLCRELALVRVVNRHRVFQVQQIDDFDLLSQARQLRASAPSHSPRNLEFVELLSRLKGKLRVWREGMGEPLSSVSGACAVYAALLALGKVSRQLFLQSPGGELELKLDEESKRVTVSGIASRLFRGEFLLTPPL